MDVRRGLYLHGRFGCDPYVLLKMIGAGNSESDDRDDTSLVALWGLDVR